MRKTSAMRFVFHGVRGSRPVLRHDTRVFGGHSTCIEVDAAEQFSIIIDGGTGLFDAGEKLLHTGKKTHHLLVTHTHWDHILGYSYFAPLYQPEHRVIFHAPKTLAGPFESILAMLRSPTQSLVGGRPVKAKIEFSYFDAGSTFLLESHVKVSTFQLNHQGVTVAYKLACDSSCGVVITDTAPIVNGNILGEGMPREPQFESTYNESLIQFVQGAHTLTYDSHFTQETIRPDWGHSTPDLALEVARQTSIKQLLLVHHAPEDSDSFVVSKLQRLIIQHSKLPFAIASVREGDEWLIPAA